MTALLIATRNAHKAREIRQVLNGDFQFLTLLDFPAAPDAIEDGATFAANASKKALVLADWLAGNSPIPPFCVLADDSGLEVDALGGAPGVHSARFAAMDTRGAVNSPDAANNAKLLRLLADVPLARRTARFRCILALRSLREPSTAGLQASRDCPPHDRGAALVPRPMPDGGQGTARPTSAEPQTILFEGVCAGRISLQPTGAGGFGYDPLFIPDGFDKSFAELGDAVKNTISHRALALQKLLQYLTLK